MKQNEIRAVYTEKMVRVYQAYSKAIAEEAVRLGTFGKKFKRERMTWIKPSFLWMMYRCVWAEKEGQERVLAIDIKREGFDYLVDNAVMSTYQKEQYGSHEEWKQMIKNSDIRCQWDPERDIYGNPLEYRSIQIGLRGEAVNKYVDEWILKITDITDHVKELKKIRDEGGDILDSLPKETEYKISIGGIERG